MRFDRNSNMYQPLFIHPSGPELQTNAIGAHHRKVPIAIRTRMRFASINSCLQPDRVRHFNRNRNFLLRCSAALAISDFDWVRGPTILNFVLCASYIYLGPLVICFGLHCIRKFSVYLSSETYQLRFIDPPGPDSHRNRNFL